jgi:hypothetical protein
MKTKPAHGRGQRHQSEYQVGGHSCYGANYRAGSDVDPFQALQTFDLLRQSCRTVQTTWTEPPLQFLLLYHQTAKHFYEGRKFTSARHSAVAESSIYQPPAIGIYIAESKPCTSDDVE